MIDGHETCRGDVDRLKREHAEEMGKQLTKNADQFDELKTERRLRYELVSRLCSLLDIAGGNNPRLWEAISNESETHKHLLPINGGKPQCSSCGTAVRSLCFRCSGAAERRLEIEQSKALIAERDAELRLANCRLRELEERLTQGGDALNLMRRVVNTAYAGIIPGSIIPPLVPVLNALDEALHSVGYKG